MLACEIARRMAADGAAVLLLCFNTPLAHCLYSFAQAHRSEAGSIWAGSFHLLCRDWSGRAGLPWKEPANSRTSEAAEFWNDESGLLLLDAAKKITDRFDVLVIDEAQDFMPDWFEILMSLLRDPSRGRVYVFRDENQDLMEPQRQASLAHSPFPSADQSSQHPCDRGVLLRLRWPRQPLPLVRAPGR